MPRSTRQTKQHASRDAMLSRRDARQPSVNRPGAIADDTQFDEGWSPRIEARVRDESLSLRVELPGFAADDLDIEIIEDMLVVRGERQESHVKCVCGCYTDEITYLVFSRTIQLPTGTNADEAIATFCDGVLQITMQFSPPRMTALEPNETGAASADEINRVAQARRPMRGRAYRPSLLSVN
ncbi:MAG: Hsp20/alpha crystallin family protein [bacterium]